ncbi:hypothetical protein ACFVH4_02110 [Nocardia ignorata]|uniref:hypothetical protein n=1 Tax=Nocardia ignorata TaxID=145285 RepID=UPI003631C4F5
MSPHPESELLAVYDAECRVTGTAERGVVYRDGLWHASAGVLVRSIDGTRIYVHRRTDSKLVFAGRHLRCHLFGFEYRHDGPIRHQPSEIADGWWWTEAELRAALSDPTWPFVPDTRAVLDDLLTGDEGPRD